MSSPMKKIKYNSYKTRHGNVDCKLMMASEANLLNLGVFNCRKKTHLLSKQWSIASGNEEEAFAITYYTYYHLLSKGGLME